jgi:hypothetical protein
VIEGGGRLIIEKSRNCEERRDGGLFLLCRGRRDIGRISGGSNCIGRPVGPIVLEVGLAPTSRPLLYESGRARGIRRNTKSHHLLLRYGTAVWALGGATTRGSTIRSGGTVGKAGHAEAELVWRDWERRGLERLR